MKLALQPGARIPVEVPCRRKWELKEQESDLVDHIRGGELQSLKAGRWLRKIQKQRFQQRGDNEGLAYVKIKGDIEKS